jgi:HEAT repeat protein
MRLSRWTIVAFLGASLACRSRSSAPDIAALVRDLQSLDSEVAGKANLALIRVGEPATPQIAELLKSEDPRLRQTAATTLWGMGAKGRAAVPDLATTVTEDAEPSVRLSAAMALGSIGPDAKDGVPALVRALKDRDTEVRLQAAKALGAIGPAAQDAIPALSQAAKNDGVRSAAEEAILQIRGSSAPTPSDAPSP